MEESHSLSCGICLLDEGKSIRGQIDSCDHYFCFVCIMEWAKIESRCPMCKRRFTIIRRAPKEGVFPCERIVIVPKRDQTHRVYGNATIGPPDPYSHVQCSVCHATTDENLLLLCDLCDMASHTYCVGLGLTVPEGDWFCHDCTVLRSEHNNAEIDTETFSAGGSQSIPNFGPECNNAELVSEIVIADGNQRIVENSRSEFNNSDNSEVMQPADANVSIFDIVHEEKYSSIPHPRNFISYWSSCPVVPGSEIIVADNATSLSGRTDQNNAGNSTELNARTLQHCRNVHGRIQALRENWSALQNRSLSFSSVSVESGARRRKRRNVSEVLCDRSDQPCSSSSGSGQQLRTQDGSSGNSYYIGKAWKMMKTAKSVLQKSERLSSSSSGSYWQLRTQDGSSGDSCDIEKAWKMMKPAKSMLQKSERAGNLHLHSKNHSIKLNASQQARNTTSSLHIVERQQPGNNDLAMEKHCEHNSHQSETENNKSLMSDCRDRITVTTVKSCEKLQSNDSTGLTELSWETQTQCDVYNVNGARLLGTNVCAASSSVAQEQGSSCLINLTRSMPGNSCSLIDKPDVCTSSSSKVNTFAEGMARKDDHAKSEIQSLVKLNLKILSRDKKLGYDEFKKVARLATHTILAACGLEHPKSGIHFFPGPTVCSHGEDIQQHCKSSLMPNSCRECFYSFVKGVVHSIMLEKIDHRGIC